jgi:F-type H+-transporting ATPase subunit b
MEVVTPLISINWTLLMVVITFAVLYFILKKVLFEKVHNFVEAREQKVQDQFDGAEAAEKLADEHLAEYKARLDGVEIERRGVLKDAKALAEKQAQHIVEEANEKAREILQQTEKEIEREKGLFAESMRDQVAMLAVLAAEKIIEQKLDERAHMAIIDEVIGQGKDGTWTH